MDEFYTRVSNVTKQKLYQYIKDNSTSLLDYNFRDFFHYCIQENKIQVMSHHFTNHKIEGLTIIDQDGISFSYERDNPKSKQNFTLCHELGHFILNHSGTCFTESVDNQENVLEKEANIFSAVVLMPNIVLLSKIYYSCENFQKVQTSLEVSKQALYFRLLDLLREYFPDKEGQIKEAVEEYIERNNASIHNFFHTIKEKIIAEFNQYGPSLMNQIRNRIDEKGFVSSQEIPELLYQENWANLKENIKHLKIWLVYNKGKQRAYAWDSLKLSDEQARKKAELQLLLM
ncbi:ImmA/IrrE family metallo-endopeptidase [Streptococcus sp. 27098_8_76]|uniref:ImmA/IrrE family metallo-endopeptidase n=1 Tax=Streptococcus sp. 27098_8_76 TaxID=3003658 RepID=UPI0021B7B4CA